jgi:hypothetical protein
MIGPAGPLRCLELKRIGERLSEEQQAFKSWCVQSAVPYVVASTLDQVLVALDAWGSLRIVIPKRGEGSR